MIVGTRFLRPFQVFLPSLYSLITVLPMIDATPAKPAQPAIAPAPGVPFEHPLMVKQPRSWSRAILWLLLLVTTGTIIWAYFAKIEEAIPAQGKLEPQASVKAVQIPVNGVVKELMVKEGQRVKAGEVLVRLDPTTAKAEVKSLEKVRTSLIQEKQFYEAQLGQAGTTSLDAVTTISPQMLSLTKSRGALIAENQLLQSQLDGGSSGMALTREQQERLQSETAELASRTAMARSSVGQLQEQLNATTVRLESAQQTLDINQKILDDLTPLAEVGGISRIQVLKQKQEAQTNRSQVKELRKEQERLRWAIAEAQAKVQNTQAVTRKDNTTQISGNLQRIAEIDTQLTKAIVDNNKRIAEIDSQISQAQQILKYSEVRSPVDGTVFDLKVSGPGYVANPNINEPILKIVPGDGLVAKVSITNQDIGFIREGMPVDVRVDSFPFSEFGDIKGEVTLIGSDALPPTEAQPYYTFPAKIRLDRQTLLANGREIPLQSGMSVSANIKIRSRTVMSIFTDSFSKTAESLKFVR
jgi:HlyD family secretion protein